MELNMYYGAGLVSTYDRYPEHKKAVLAKYPKRKRTEESKGAHHHHDADNDDHQGLDIDIESTFELPTLEEHKAFDRKIHLKPQMAASHGNKKGKAKKFKDEESKRKWEEMMTIKRRKLFSSIVKKEISKQHRSKMNKHKEMVLQCKRVATQCQKTHRLKAVSIGYFKVYPSLNIKWMFNL